MSVNVIVELTGLADRCVRVGATATAADLHRQVDRLVGRVGGGMNLFFEGTALRHDDVLAARGVRQDSRVRVDVECVAAVARFLLKISGDRADPKSFKAAADDRDYGAVRLMLATGEVKGRGLLHDALHDAAHVAGLCEAGISPETVDSDGYSPLHFAVLEHHLDAIPALVRYGACVDPTTLTGLSPMHIAAFEGFTDAIAALHKHGADVDLRTVYDYTPLHFAALNGHVDAVALLLDVGARANARNSKRVTPIEYAYEHDHVDVLHVLNKRLPVHEQRQPRPAKRAREPNVGALATPVRDAKRRCEEVMHVMHMQHLG